MTESEAPLSQSDLDRGFRRVTHIEHRTGARGGRWWWLTLECGHSRSVHNPPFRHVFQKVRHAPRKLKCLMNSCRKT